MEHIRRRRRAKRRKRNRDSGRGSALTALFALGITAFAIYALFSDGALSWVSENIVSPVTAFFSSSDTEDELDAPRDTDAVSASTDISIGGSDVMQTSSLELALPSIECYMLQMGVYSSETNAKAWADTIKGRGAAGFILEDDSGEGLRYRVIAAGYLDEGSAREVKDRLTGEGIDSAIYKARSPMATFRVTATEDALGDVKAGFASFAPLQQAMAEAAIAIDRDSLSVAEGKALIQDALDAFSYGTDSLASHEGDSAALSNIAQTCGNITDSLSSLIGKEYESDIAFSSSVKYNYLYIVSQYEGLIKKLSE